MEFTNKNFNLKVNLKHVAIIILIIAMSVLIFTGKLKEPSISAILSSIIAIISK